MFARMSVFFVCFITSPSLGLPETSMYKGFKGILNSPQALCVSAFQRVRGEGGRKKKKHGDRRFFLDK